MLSISRPVSLYFLFSSLITLYLFTNAKNIVLYSAMDSPYLPKYENYTNSKLDYCQRHKYQYLYKPSDFGLTDGGKYHPNYYRIVAGMKILSGEVSQIVSNSVDYIVYIDADAFVVEKELPFEALITAAEHYVQTTKSIENKDECYFITQDYHHGINSGFWLLKNTPWSLKFLQDWLNDCGKEQKYKFNWVFDQGPLQNVILHHAAALQNITYNDDCWSTSKYDHAANMCWMRFLRQWNFPFEQRKIGHICLLPSNVGVPLRHHMHGIHKPGEMIRHQKGLTGDQIDSEKSYFQRVKVTEEKTQFLQSFRLKPGSLIRQAHKHSKSVFIIQEDGRKHLIPNGRTFAAMKLSFLDVISLNDELFDSIPLGSEIPPQ